MENLYCNHPSLSSYISLSSFVTLIVTWNVNSNFENPDEIQNKLLPFEISPELIVIGLQEIVELTTSNILLSSSVKNQSYTERISNWIDNFQFAIQAKYQQEYELLASENMVGLFICAFSSNKIKKNISNVQTATHARGVGGVLGNKGAVYIKFNVNNTSICIVNAHFTAHREKVNKRNQDFYHLLHTKVFPDPIVANLKNYESNLIESFKINYLKEKNKEIRKKIKLNLQAQQHREDYHKSRATELIQNYLLYDIESKIPSLAANDFDMILWLGDLNYRIIQEVDMEKVYDMIDLNQLSRLFTFDQLYEEMENGNVFQNFHEGLINFSPTYQYIPGTDSYDRRKDKKMRCPAWCDRILWRVGIPSDTPTEFKLIQDVNSIAPTEDSSDSDSDVDQIVSEDKEIDIKINSDRLTRTSKKVDVPLEILPETIELLQYERSENNISDHKPVKALMNLKVKSVNLKDLEDHLTTEVISLFNFDKDISLLSVASPIFYSLTPSSILLHSITHEGNSAVVSLRNSHGRYSLQYTFEEPDKIPEWLNMSNLFGDLNPLNSTEITVSCNHEKTTLQFADQINESVSLKELYFPMLGSKLSLACNDINMTVSSILSVQLQWHFEGQVKFVEKISLPICCSLAPELDILDY